MSHSFIVRGANNTGGKNDDGRNQKRLEDDTRVLCGTAGIGKRVSAPPA